MRSAQIFVKLFIIVFYILLGCKRGTRILTPVCINFQQQGVVYGASAGHQSGNVIFTLNRIPVSVFEFYSTVGGVATFNFARTEAPPISFGTGRTIRANNINLEFDFSKLSFIPSEVTFKFLDKGGVENISVNGSQIYIGDLPSVPTQIGQVSIVVFTMPVQGGREGMVTLKGPIENFRIGGQELWLDIVCAKKMP